MNRGARRLVVVRVCLATLLLGCLWLLVAGCKNRPPPPSGARCSSDDPGRAQSKACRSSSDKASCEAAGGNWNNGHLEKMWACDCPSPGCWCEEASDCVGSCIARASSPQDCKDAYYGVCVTIFRGCGCQLQDGKWSYLCAD